MIKDIIHFEKWENADTLAIDGSLPKDWFEDITYISRDNKELNGYNTQKPMELIKRFILASTNEGDLVADFYMGSGRLVK